MRAKDVRCGVGLCKAEAGRDLCCRGMNGGDIGDKFDFEGDSRNVVTGLVRCWIGVVGIGEFSSVVGGIFVGRTF